MSKLTKDNARTERRRNRSKRAQNNISNRPRFVVSRSLKNIQGQIIDDINGKTLLSVSSLDKSLKSEIETTRSTVLSLIEPLIIIVMGGFILLIVMAILIPIMQMNTLILN